MARHYARVLTTVALAAAMGAAVVSPAAAQAIDRYGQAVVADADGSLHMTIDLRMSGDGTPMPTPRGATRQGALSVAAVAHGNQRLTFRFVNLTGATIPAFDAALALPAGFEIAAIDAVDPPVTDATVTLPYAVRQQDGRPVIAIAQRALQPGAAVGLTFRSRASTPHTGLLIVLAALALGYLVRFRDLTRDPHLHASGSAR